MTYRFGAGLLAFSTSAAVLLGLLWASPRHVKSSPHLSLQPAELRANGYASAILQIDDPSPTAPKVTILDNAHAATVLKMETNGTGWHAKIRAGVLPGRITLLVEIPNAPPATIALTTTLDPGDFAEDGTPDFLRLLSDADQRAFRHWFVFLAEVQYFQEPAARPAEINDCAALVRYAYREALREHDSRWAAGSPLTLMPALNSVARYHYPYTPLGAALFRVRPGSFAAADFTSGAFAEFADVQTLQRLNTHFVSRDLARALPGDLLFFRQESGHMPFHSMIYVGESQISKDRARYIVYHTGPDGASPGEIRRWTVPELVSYPEPQWRPIDENNAFLGVYRWNILRRPS